MNRTGDTLGGRYELTERIAAGGMGEVWKSRDQILGRTVALKLLKDGLTDEVGFTERFRNEARLSAALTHGNIAQVYDYGEDEGTAYLVMEFVPGMPLSKIIAENAPISAADTAGLITQAAQALHAAHRNGLIHRDVKPANMLVTADGLVKLTDFGIARAVGASAMTKTGEVMGTAQYLAPEAALGKEVTGLSDVYALGVVAYEMLCGRRPFESDTPVTLALAHVNQPPPQMPDEVPPPVRAVVLATLEKDPALRPDSAAEFARALRQAVIDCGPMGFDPHARPAKPGAAPGGNSGPSATSGPHSPQQLQQAQPGAALPGRHVVEGHPFPTGPAAPPQSHPAAAAFQGESEPRPTGPNAPGSSGPQQNISGPNHPISGPHFQQSGPQPQQSSLAGIPKALWWAIGGVIALIVVVLIIVLTSGGGSVKEAPTSMAPQSTTNSGQVLT
ncbi:protein kinase domain-containing protein [Calidifontibacter terrae]